MLEPDAFELNARQRLILERLMLEKEVKISELSERFRVTEMTIRRDLEKLEETGTVKRTFGGAIHIGQDLALQDRSVLNMEAKLRIGRSAAASIRPGESIFIDGGTTTLQVAKCLPHGMKITVVTNALNIAAELLNKQIPTVVTGGMLVEATNSLVGPLAAQCINDMAFDRAFLGTTGISAGHGFSNSNLYEAEVKRLAASRSAEMNVVADSTKFGVRSLASFAPLAAASRIWTDSMPEEPLAGACEEAGVRIELAE
ncbi:DeoR family transcriptional regulator [Paenibacillus cisolokensis]|uniref:DeoR family transcriptional regulator n=1 Tax=Paenibacillus cisolokensis TaxID=1658519 RepID=A0ABQ4N5H6_9BACL|nr:DeoR/GlpR family DNA-binding transcription regulator [Paenibacillus cisolokensis]GIQ63473.1 DeoR family transcriptional regulator [Paenibacillus cisolokensis]